MGKLFGTDGIRGKIGAKPLTSAFFYRLALAAGKILSGERDVHRIFIGKDTRNSSDMIESCLSAGFLTIGLEVVHLGIVTTPAIAAIIRTATQAVGVMISASHNPYLDNGVKFFTSDGFKLSDDLENQVETLLDDEGYFQKIDGILEKSETIRFGVIKSGTTRIRDYLAELKGHYLRLLRQSPPYPLPHIHCDCANGGCAPFAKRLFRSIGIKTTQYFVGYDGININQNCGATHPEILAAIVRRKGGLGFCFDGDGDRMVAIDEQGEVVNGDQTLLIIATHFKKSGWLKNPAIAVTVMSNLGLMKALEKVGIRPEITPVGDRYVLEAMVKHNILIGGEQSGHLIFRDFSTTGDGFLSALILLAVIQREGKPLSELKKQMTVFPQILKNIRVRQGQKEGYKTNPLIQAAIASESARLGDRGRILVRASGTENLVRLMAEGEDARELETILGTLSALVKKELGG